VPVLKYVVAVGGDVVCRLERNVTVNGRWQAVARSHDSQGNKLPTWSGCRQLENGEVFLLNPHPESFDGRYFGSISQDHIIGRGYPL